MTVGRDTRIGQVRETLGGYRLGDIRETVLGDNGRGQF